MTLQQLYYIVCIADQKSMNRAAKFLYVSQPSLSNTVKELEKEVGFSIFIRSNRGIEITPKGEEFLSYARQMTDLHHIIEERFSNTRKMKQKFSVSMQHYSFAVQAFIELVKKLGMEDYEFAVHETKTYEVIENVRKQKSEIGILYLNEYNEQALRKIFNSKDLAFIPLFTCDIYVYLWRGHPLAKKEKLNFEELMGYPCLSFEQGDNNSFFLAEEVHSIHEYKQIIKADDRATMLNLMIGLNGYTLCSGIISEELNGKEYCAILLQTKEKMQLGYIKKKQMSLSHLGKSYIRELQKIGKSLF